MLNCKKIDTIYGKKKKEANTDQLITVKHMTIELMTIG